MACRCSDYFWISALELDSKPLWNSRMLSHMYPLDFSQKCRIYSGFSNQLSLVKTDDFPKGSRFVITIYFAH